MPLKIDNWLLGEFANVPSPPSVNSSEPSRWLFQKFGLPTIQFDTSELAIFSSPTAQLSGCCMNGAAAMLQDRFLLRLGRTMYPIFYFYLFLFYFYYINIETS